MNDEWNLDEAPTSVVESFEARIEGSNDTIATVGTVTLVGRS